MTWFILREPRLSRQTSQLSHCDVRVTSESPMRIEDYILFLRFLKKRPRTLQVWLQLLLYALLTPIYCLGMAALATAMAPYLFVSFLSAWLENRRWRRWYARHFGEQVPDDIIAASPFEYSHVYQGDDGYTIHDKRRSVSDANIGFASSLESARRFILERIVADQQSTPNP
jgi:hypothetical protein